MPDSKILPGQFAVLPEVSSDPAVATPPVTVPSSDKILERIKAKVKGLAPASQGGTAPQPKPPADPKVDVSEDENKGLSIPPKVLRQLGELQTKVRELEPKAKELDSFKTDAELAREVKKLWSGTHEEKIAALAKISGKDGLDELAAIIKTYYTLEQEGGADDDGEPASPKLKAMADQLAAANKKIDDLIAERSKEKDEGVKKASDVQIQQANDYVKSFIERNKAKFVICARPENQKDAIEDVQDAAMTIIQRDKIDLKTMDQKTAEAVYLEALQETEAEYENTGKRFSKASAETRDPELGHYERHVRVRSKPDVVIQEEELSKDPDIRFAQLKKRAREKAEAGLYNGR